MRLALRLFAETRHHHGRPRFENFHAGFHGQRYRILSLLVCLQQLGMDFRSVFDCLRFR